MKKKMLSLIIIVFMFGGCASHQVSQRIAQSVIPVELTDEKEICIIQNSYVRENFFLIYQQVLESKGFQVTILPPDEVITACHITSTYTAVLKAARLLYEARIEVFKDGYSNGEAYFSHPRRFADVEEKLPELINQLFPF